jgi:hypothetical protein
MLHLRCLTLCLSTSLLLAFPTAAQVPQSEGEVNLSATETYAVLAPAITPSTLIPFHVDVEGRDSDGFDVTVANAGAVVSLLLPSGTEVNSLNADSLGFGFDVIPADSEAVTSGLFISFFSLSGTHTLIRLPSTCPTGTYQIKINTASLLTATPVYASYLSGSPIRAALSPDAPSYRVGDTVVLSAFIFNGTTPVTNATIDAAVADQEHPETPPVQVSMQDSGTNDAAPGDGIYTGLYTAATAGRFVAAIRATGTAPSGSAYTRTASTDFRVLPPLAGFNSFSDAGVDDNGNGLIDRVAVTATVQVQSAGNYRLELSLAASNGREARASATANLLAGVQQITASFSATQVSGLGVDGPYTIKNATLLYTDDPEEPVAAFRENAGPTFAYTLSSLEHPALKFTGNNTVTGIDTNGNGKFDLLRIEVEVSAITAATYEWSGTLRDTAGREIQALDGSSAMSAGNNTITFNFDGIKIAQHGVNGPYALSSVLVFNNDAAVHESELLQTQAFSVNDFECSGAPALAIQSVALTPSSITGGNATTLHVNLAEAAGTCGAKVTISSDNPALIVAALPATVIVPSGQSSADVTVITSGVSASTQVNLIATSGASSQSAALTVTPSSLSNLSLSYTALQAGAATAAKVELDGAAPAAGTTISLSSGNPGVASVPASVVIPAGERSVEFTVNTNSSLQGSTAVNITAALGLVTKVATLTVYAEIYINGSITPGGPPVTVTAESGQNFLLAFDGSAGQRVSLRMTDVTIGTSSCCGAYVSIKKPDGSYLIAPTYVGTAGGFIDATALPITGSYTIVVDPVEANTGSMTLTLYDVPPDFTTTLTPGGPPVSASVTVPGQNARLTFDGTAGQRVSLKISGVTINYSNVYIYKPDGTPLTNSSSVSTGGSFIGAMTLPAAGTYAILIDPSDYYTGSITLTLYDLPPDVTGSITPGGPSVTVNTTAPGQKAQLTFDGTAAQRVSLKISGVTMTGGNGYVDVYIRKPDGATLASANYVSSGGGFVDVQTLPATGTYTLLVSPQDTNIGSLTLTLYDVPPDVTGNITLGTPLTVTTGVPGQNAQISFDGAAGQRITVNIGGVTLAGGNGYVDVALKNPDGTTLASVSYVGSGGAFINTQTLPVTGAYNILVNPQGSNTGSVSLTLNDVSADVISTIVPGGSSATVTTTSVGQNAQVTFDGNAGQRVSLKISDVAMTGGNGYVDVYIKKPDGTILASSSYVSTSGGFIDTQTLPVTGTYTILVDPQGTNTGSVTLTLYDVPADITGSITAGGPAVTITTTTVGQNAILTFSGTAGQRVSLQLSNSTFSGCLAVYDTIKNPDGTILTWTYLCSATGFIDTVVLPVTGSYTILIDPQGTTTGSQTLVLNNVP